MTRHDLSTLLHEHVTRDEPVQAPDPWVSVRSGQRRLRARRLAAGGAAAAVLAGAGVSSVVLLSGDQGPDGTRGIDPASARALAAYDAQEMPRILDERVRSVLERSVADLGPAAFEASDGQGAELPRRHYDKASQMSVEYGTPAHELRVDVLQARGEAEGSATRYCAEGLAEGIYLECEVDTDADGNVVISKLGALKPHGVTVDGGRTWIVVPAEELETTDPDRLWFSRDVKVIKSKTLVTYASETVKAPNRQAAEDEFEVPLGDLVEIGTDPVLVVPAPPTDDSGCGPWTLDPDVSSSC